MMSLLTAPSLLELIPLIARECLRLGKFGAVIEGEEVREINTPPYQRFEWSLQYRWAEIDEPKIIPSVEVFPI